MSQKRMITVAAQATTQVRRKLREAGITADSIRSSTFSGGNSVTILLTDVRPGIVQRVQEICQPHVIGNFDGMTDTYVYRPSRDPETPRVKYLHVNNQMSREIRERITAFGKERFRDYDHQRDHHRLFDGRLPHFWEEEMQEAAATGA